MKVSEEKNQVEKNVSIPKGEKNSFVDFLCSNRISEVHDTRKFSTLKSVHFKKTVARISILFLWYFLICIESTTILIDERFAKWTNFSFLFSFLIADYWGLKWINQKKIIPVLLKRSKIIKAKSAFLIFGMANLKHQWNQKENMFVVNVINFQQTKKQDWTDIIFGHIGFLK